MRILLFGADGFIGSNVSAELIEHEVHKVIRDKDGVAGPLLYQADLTDVAQVTKVVRQVQPDVILNCAGVVANDESAELNIVFTSNILEAVHTVDSKPLVIVCGSAGVYGPVDKHDLPVSELTPLRAAKGYGLYKLREEQRARELARSYDIPLTVARIFNPIGAGMHPRLLLPQIIKQAKEIIANKREHIELNRADACRDYIAVSDVAAALAALATSSPKEDTYNIGSGQPTSNQELVSLVIEVLGHGKEMPITELSDNPEPQMACQADISRLQGEYGWKPSHSLKQTIEEIANARR